VCFAVCVVRGAFLCFAFCVLRLRVVFAFAFAFACCALRFAFCMLRCVFAVLHAVCCILRYALCHVCVHVAFCVMRMCRMSYFVSPLIGVSLGSFWRVCRLFVCTQRPVPRQRVLT